MKQFYVRAVSWRLGVDGRPSQGGPFNEEAIIVARVLQSPQHAAHLVIHDIAHLNNLRENKFPFCGFMSYSCYEIRQRSKNPLWVTWITKKFSCFSNFLYIMSHGIISVYKKFDIELVPLPRIWRYLNFKYCSNCQHANMKIGPKVAWFSRLKITKFVICLFDKVFTTKLITVTYFSTYLEGNS